MSKKYMDIYLNDHLSGSVTALELLDYLKKKQVGHLEQSFATLRADITADRNHLEALMKQEGVSTSLVRKAMAWLAEKAAEIKLRADDPAQSALLLLEALDALSIGIEGKRLLWKALAAAGVSAPPGIDYSVLDQRAVEQRGRVEEMRLQSACAALRA